jgi:hypothetical protein
MLFKASNKSLRKVQTALGVYLHTTGVPTQVITLLSQYGLSVGCKSLEHIMESLATHQKERLRALGQTITDKQLVSTTTLMCIKPRISCASTIEISSTMESVDLWLGQSVIEQSQLGNPCIQRDSPI